VLNFTRTVAEATWSAQTRKANRDRNIMHKLYLSSSIHAPGDILREGNFRLGPPDVIEEGAAPDEMRGYIVVPLTNIGTDQTTGSDVAGAIRIVARLSEVTAADEEYLPSLNFDFNPALEPFLNGYPYPRFVEDEKHEYLIAPVGTMDHVTIFAVTPVTQNRKRQIRDGLLTFRQAFKDNPYPVFLTLDFYTYSLRQHSDYPGLFIPSRGLRYPQLFQRPSKSKLRRIEKRVKSWNF
jgi:hypothetical protein